MSVRLAILDMYDNTENLGMAGILRLVEQSGITDYEIFDVRAKGEVPGLGFDIYIASGGPGDPRETGDWGPAFAKFLDDLWAFNHSSPACPKYVMFICHSFQMACHHFKVGKITKRRKQSFGVFPVHKTDAGQDEWLFEWLPDPFYVADFRYYQLVKPDMDRLAEMEAEILLREKKRPHVPLERAIMGVRFGKTCIGLQFHPEAHAAGMIEHFYKKKIKEKVLELKGEEKFARDDRRPW